MNITSELIIGSASRSPWIRVRDTLLCVGLWYIYFLLMQDFFNFVSTIMAWEVFDEVSPGLPKAFEILATMKNYALVILALGAMLLSWAVYNQMRFRGSERRKSAPIVTVDELGQHYNLNPQDITSWRTARVMTMYHDGLGNLVNVHTNTLPQDGAELSVTVAA